MLTGTIVTKWEKLRLAEGGQQRTEIRGDRRVTRKAALMATQWDNLEFFSSLSANETMNQPTRQISTASHRLVHLNIIFLWQIRSACLLSSSVPLYQPSMVANIFCFIERSDSTGLREESNHVCLTLCGTKQSTQFYLQHVEILDIRISNRRRRRLHAL